ERAQALLGDENAARAEQTPLEQVTPGNLSLGPRFEYLPAVFSGLLGLGDATLGTFLRKKKHGRSPLSRYPGVAAAPCDEHGEERDCARRDLLNSLASESSRVSGVLGGTAAIFVLARLIIAKKIFCKRNF